MFITSDHYDDQTRSVTVYVDDDVSYPILMRIKIGGLTTRVYMNRDEALNIMSQLEKAIHQTAK